MRNLLPRLLKKTGHLFLPSHEPWQGTPLFVNDLIVSVSEVFQPLNKLPETLMVLLWLGQHRQTVPASDALA